MNNSHWKPHSQWKFDNSDEAQLSSIKTKVDKKKMTNYCHLPLHALKKIDFAISPKLIFLRIFCSIQLNIFKYTYMNLEFSDN